MVTFIYHAQNHFNRLSTYYIIRSKQYVKELQQSIQKMEQIILFLSGS